MNKRTRKFSMEEPYARASDEDLANMCLSGGRPVLRQSVSVREQPVTLDRYYSSQNSPNIMIPQNPVLTRSASGDTNMTTYFNYNALNFSQPNLKVDTLNKEGGFVTQPNITNPHSIYTTSLNTSLPFKAPQTTSSPNGVFTFKPREGRFPAGNDSGVKMEPYCKIKIGHHGAKTSIARKEGNFPIWNDAITLERAHNEQFAKIKVKDYDRFILNENIGEIKIPLSEIASLGKMSQWYPIYKKNHQTGQIFVDITFEPRNTSTYY